MAPGRPTSLGLVIGAILTCGPAIGTAQQAPVTQKQIAAWITTGSMSEKSSALQYVSTLPPEQREPVLEDALIKELDRLNQENQKRFEVLREGKTVALEGQEPGAYRLAVIKAVSDSVDPKVIPALVGALGSGIGVSKGLAKFGDLAVDPVAAAARNRNPDLTATPDALRALQLMIESGQRLSNRSIDQISSVARDKLTGPQYYLHVIAAMDLAIATQDRGLRLRVEQLASEPLQIRQLGITDATQARRVRDAAAAALLR